MLDLKTDPLVNSAFNPVLTAKSVAVEKPEMEWVWRLFALRGIYPTGCRQ